MKTRMVWVGGVVLMVLVVLVGVVISLWFRN